MRTFAVLFLILLLVAAVAMLVYFNPGGTTLLGDGAYPLEVTISSPNPGAIEEITCEAFGEATAPTVSEYVWSRGTPLFGAVDKPFRGTPVTVLVPFTVRVRGWSETRNYPFKKLVVVVQYRDGKRTGKMLDIPHPDDSRSVEAEFP